MSSENDAHVENVALGVWFFIRESVKQTHGWPSPEAVAEYYTHLYSVTIHRSSLESDVARFVRKCLQGEYPEIKAFRESRGRGLQRENVEQGRVLCANEPGCE